MEQTYKVLDITTPIKSNKYDFNLESHKYTLFEKKLLYTGEKSFNTLPVRIKTIGWHKI